MRLSKQTSDAVKILVFCARTRGERVKVAEIADKTDVTKALGLKLVNLLSRLKYLETVRGPKGGIRLSCDPATTRLGDVVRGLEAFEMADDGLRSKALRVDGEEGIAWPPVLEGCVDNAFEAFVAVLNQNTLSDLAMAAAPVELSDEDKPTESVRSARRKPKMAPHDVEQPARGGAS